MHRRQALVLVASATIGGVTLEAIPSEPKANGAQDHVAWVGGVLQRMEAIKPGMTREMLLTIFTTEGGIFTRLCRTFVSRDCPYFKVDVEFKAVGMPDLDENRGVRIIEGKQDIIVKVSRPYLQFSTMD